MLNTLRRLLGLASNGAKPSQAAMQDDADREAFYRLFRGITKRVLVAPPAVAVPAGSLGATRRVCISTDPEGMEQHIGVQAGRPANCAVCGGGEGAMLDASLEPEYESGLSLLLPVRVHSDCLAGCTATNEQRGIPW